MSPSPQTPIDKIDTEVRNTLAKFVQLHDAIDQILAKHARNDRRIRAAIVLFSIFLTATAIATLLASFHWLITFASAERILALLTLGLTLAMLYANIFRWHGNFHEKSSEYVRAKQDALYWYNQLSTDWNNALQSYNSGDPLTPELIDLKKIIFEKRSHLFQVAELIESETDIRLS